jgi:hypothetical protein
METPEMQDMAVARQLIEVLLDRCKSDDAFEMNIAAKERKALQKSLESSKMLLGIAHHLMVPPDPSTTRDSAERLKALHEEIKMAARAAYQAGLLLTGRD